VKASGHRLHRSSPRQDCPDPSRPLAQQRSTWDRSGARPQGISSPAVPVQEHCFSIRAPHRGRSRRVPATPVHTTLARSTQRTTENAGPRDSKNARSVARSTGATQTTVTTAERFSKALNCHCARVRDAFKSHLPSNRRSATVLSEGRAALVRDVKFGRWGLISSGSLARALSQVSALNGQSFLCVLSTQRILAKALWPDCRASPCTRQATCRHCAS